SCFSYGRQPAGSRIELFPDLKRRNAMFLNLLRRVALSLLFSSSCIVLPVLAAAEGARVVTYGKEDVVPVHAKVRFSTLIVLPDSEEILDFTTGDREFWII